MMLLAIILLFILIPSATFVVTYGLVRPWHTSWEGRELMTSATAWTLLAIGFLIQEWSGVVLHHHAWSLVGLIAAAAAWLKLGLLLHAVWNDTR